MATMTNTMQKAGSLLAPVSNRWNRFWEARTHSERRYLGVGMTAVLLTLLYLLLIAPALNGRAQLEKRLPQLHEQNAQMQALALEAGSLAGKAGAPAGAQGDSIELSLARHGLSAQSVALMGDFAKVQLNGAGFAPLLAWLADAQRTSRVTVQDAAITAQPTPGMVNATLTLRVKKGE